MNQLLDRQPPARPRFTEKQGQYLAFIWTYGLLNARSPLIFHGIGGEVVCMVAEESENSDAILRSIR